MKNTFLHDNNTDAYNKAINEMTPIAYATVKDGYSGNLQRIKLTLLGNKIMEVSKKGSFHPSILPPVIDTREALWLIHNHPLALRYKRIESLIN